MRVHIIGAGLLGTSIGMALTAQGMQVRFSDLSARSLKLAQGLINTDLPTADEQEVPADLLIAAVPTAFIPRVIIDSFKNNLALNFTDVGSVKTKCVAEIQAFDESLAALYCGGHPMAGREVSGPESAQADLFDGRPWILTPTDSTSSHTLDLVSDVLKAVGATEFRMSPSEHDRAVALISHAPQILASLMAGELVKDESGGVALAGQGLRDVTRIAASDSQLWSGILSANASALTPVLASMHARLGELISSLHKPEGLSRVTEFLKQGVAGRELLPGKHGAHREYVVLPVLIDDAPGQLKRLFNDAGDAQINIEDVSMEHSPGHPTGLVQISVAPDAAADLERYLLERGWRIYPPRNPANLS